MSHNEFETILIVDFGSQYTPLIARVVRELGVYCEVVSWQTPSEELKQFKPAGVILSGGPETVTKAESPQIPSDILEFGCPVLGICYGMQAMAAYFGGKVESGHKREFGHAHIAVHGPSKLLGDAGELHVWMSHSDHVVSVPEGFSVQGSSRNCPITIMADERRDYYGVQFHVEVSHTPLGKQILGRFTKDICGCKGSWQSAAIIDDLVHQIQKQVGNEHVVLGLSGGVDSSVVAALLYKSIGKQVTCVLVDNGLLRLGEVSQIEKYFKEELSIPVQVIDARERFFNALKGLDDPELKRKAVGRVFIEVFEAHVKKMPNVKWLGQGTIYSDVLESARTKWGHAHVIKSHHNVGGLPERMNLKILEPLRELFKDEVRKIGRLLGLPASLIDRHPFPGPGLSVRVLGEVKPEYLEIVGKADAIWLEELTQSGWYEKVSQAFAVYLPVNSVGVKGDARHYGPIIALRAVQTNDFMTAHWAHLPPDVLQRASRKILNEIPEVSRVVYDISDKPPATIEWE